MPKLTADAPARSRMPQQARPIGARGGRAGTHDRYATPVRSADVPGARRTITVWDREMW